MLSVDTFAPNDNSRCSQSVSRETCNDKHREHGSSDEHWWDTETRDDLLTVRRCQQVAGSVPDARSTTRSSHTELPLPTDTETLHHVFHNEVQKGESIIGWRKNHYHSDVLGYEGRAERSDIISNGSISSKTRHPSSNTGRATCIRRPVSTAAASGAAVGGRPPMVECWEGRGGLGVGSGEERGHPRRRIEVRDSFDDGNGSSCAKGGAEDVKPSTAESRIRRTGDCTVSNGRAAAARFRRRASGRVHNEKSCRDRGKPHSQMMEGSKGGPAPVIDDAEDRHGASMSPLRTDSRDESLSMSSASDSIVAPELSMSSLPPMRTLGMATATDLVLEDSSFEDITTSASVASSPNKATMDGEIGIAEGNNERRDGWGRRSGPSSYRQRQSATDAFVRNRCQRGRRGSRHKNNCSSVVVSPLTGYEDKHVERDKSMERTRYHETDLPD